jgi:hypothetical protein
MHLHPARKSTALDSTALESTALGSTALGSTALGALLAAVVAALVLLPTLAASAATIEPFPAYQPQTRCSPKAKPGTLELSRWLQRRYDGTGSLGISRPCHSGGVSEHKEGRAFDWAVSADRARDRRQVRAFIHKVRATDRFGNPDALARRMSIMYFIWNDHIYSAYNQYRKRDYLSSSCTSLRRCSDTLRHRNHVHISLTRAGGRGLTSWYLR